MAKDLSAHQQKIVKRYYEHHETIQNNKLAELISELWLAEDDKVKTKLWGKAQIALMRLGVDANKVAQVVANQDVTALAALAKTVDASGAAAANQASTSTTTGKPRSMDPLHQDNYVHPRSVSVSDGRTVKQMMAEKAAASGFDSLEEDNLKRALKAFRKKLKTIKRDDESKLGRGHTTYGRPSAISAITPPREFPDPVWYKLVELGRLKKAGQGTYELP